MVAPVPMVRFEVELIDTILLVDKASVPLMLILRLTFKLLPVPVFTVRFAKVIVPVPLMVCAADPLKLVVPVGKKIPGPTERFPEILGVAKVRVPPPE